MSVVIDGTSGITTPAETVQGALTTTGNTILGDSSADTLNVGNGGLVKDASGNVGIGTASPTEKLTVVGNIRGEILYGNRSSVAAVTAGGLGVGIDGSVQAQIVSPSSSAMALYTGGTERMRLDSSGNLLFNSGYGSAATAYGCRAWVNFNGTGTVAIRASGNVSSITDNGTGDYTVNFTTAMPDANYCVTTGFTRDATNNNYGMYLQPGQNTGAFYATTFVRVYSGYAGAGTLYDMAVCHVAIFR